MSEPNPSLNPDSPEDTNNEGQQWIVLHDMKVVGFYDSRSEAASAMDGYRLGHSLGINSILIVRQII